MSLPTASGLTRAFRCRASLVLPRVSRATNAAASKGIAVHRFFEDLPRLGRDAALAAIEDPDARLLCEALDVEALPLGDGVSWVAEAAFSLSLDTGVAREVGRGIGREYPDDGGLHGTADLVALSPDGETVHVLDVKSGHGWLPPAAQSEQLKALALMAARAYGASRARIGHLKVRDDGSTWLDVAELEAFDLDVFFAELVTLSETKEAQPAEGEWCRYCPAWPHCPAKMALAARLANGIATPDVTMSLTPERAAQAWERLKAARMVLDEVEAKVKEYARDTPLKLADGSWLGPVQTERVEFDGRLTFEALAKAYGEPVAMRAVELEATKKGIDRAMRAVAEELKRKGEKPTLRALKEAALDVVRKAGALTTKTKIAVRESRLETATE